MQRALIRITPFTKFPSNFLFFKPSNFSTTTAMAPKLDIHSKIKLNSGHEIPILGYGVYQTPANVAEDVVLHALKTGYRHVDSATVYRNEAPSAAAIKKSGIPREQIFFTSKVSPRSMNYEAARVEVDESLRKTGFGYIDLYLLHAPYGGKKGRLGAWKALVEKVNEGKVRSIGVSNYGVHHLDELEQYIKETDSKEGAGKGGVLSVNQVELHPWLARPDIVGWCKQRGVVLEAYSPLVRAQRIGDKRLVALSKKHGKTEAQVLLRWSVQMVSTFRAVQHAMPNCQRVS